MRMLANCCEGEKKRPDMRHLIETAPRDGNAVILEDEATGTYDVAHWSAKASEWISENGNPSEIIPTHWCPMSRNENLLQENKQSSRPSQPGPTAWRRGYGFFVDVIAAVALIGLLFHVIRDARQQDIVRTSTTSGQVVSQGTQFSNQNPNSTPPAFRQTEINQASVPAQTQEVTRVALASAPEALQSPKEHAEAFAQELTEARRALQDLNVQLRAEAAKSAQSLGQERLKTATLAQEVAAARQELTATTAQHRQAFDQESARSVALASELATAQLAIEAQAALLRKVGDETGQLTHVEAAKSAQSLEQERQKAADLAQEAAAARQELTASTAKHRQAIEEERSRSAALASDLATARSEIEMQAVQLRTASDETGKLKQAEAAKSAQSLEQERQKTAERALEVAAARQELIATTAQHRQALDEERARRAALWSELAVAQHEIETQAAQLRNTGDEIRQLKQATESAIVKPRQSLQQEREGIEAIARDHEPARRTIDVRVMSELAANNPISAAVQAVEVAAMAPPAAVETRGNPEATRLIARASALLGKGDIGAARTVLERATETGNAQASFMLAETYDPGILSTWGTYGTRGEVTKAREFYARAHAGGIQEAKNRVEALDQ
jgi:hypothetical protein